MEIRIISACGGWELLSLQVETSPQSTSFSQAHAPRRHSKIWTEIY